MQYSITSISALKPFLAGLIMAGIVGCSSTGGVEEGTAENENPATEEVAEESAEGEVAESTDVAEQATADPLLQTTTIYFAFDRSDLTSEFESVLNAHAAYLVSNPEMSVVLEGHADERGTTEYNMALGERRAEKAKQYLVVQGVNPSQISTVSYGEEQPAVLSSDEESWAKNRRTEIKY